MTGLKEIIYSMTTEGELLKVDVDAFLQVQKCLVKTCTTVDPSMIAFGNF